MWRRVAERRGEVSWAAGRALGACLLLVFALAAGCRSEPEPPPPMTEPEYEGISREEIELRAEPMTPAEAERLGIVDTTIRIEAPIHPDSVIHLEGGEVLPVDTAPRQ